MARLTGNIDPDIVAAGCRPNLITLTGFAFVLFNLVCVAYYLPELAGPRPFWLALRCTSPAWRIVRIHRTLTRSALCAVFVAVEFAVSLSACISTRRSTTLMAARHGAPAARLR